jgi:hypothetical protein
METEMINCAHCKNKHQTVAEVKACSQVKMVQAPATIIITPMPVKKTLITEPGMYWGNNGAYLVVQTKDGKNLYAKKLVTTMAGDKVHKLHFEYEKGAIWSLDAADKMTVEQVAKLGKTTGHCWVCAKPLKVKKSIEAGIGPVCIKKV